MKKLLLSIFLISLISLSFSSLIWQASADGPVVVKPVVQNGMVTIASGEGKLYALSPDSGSKKWQIFIGKTPNEILAFGNSFIISTSEGKIVRVGNDGKVIWSTDLNSQFNVSVIYGAATNQKRIFVTADNGVYAIENGGSAAKILALANESASPPAAGSDFVVYGAGNELIKMREDGQIQWRTKIKGGKFWTSRPKIDSGTVYIGALDGALHAVTLSNGAELWQVKTPNWVMSTPITKEGVVYFGGNDGAIYAVEQGSGSIVWKAQTQLAIEGEPELGSMGGKEVIFVGGTDKSIYAVDRQSGSIVWKGSSSGSIGSPLYYQNSIIFGSGDKSVYSYTTERACSILLPTEAADVGVKELKVTGNHVSEAGGAKVSISINNGEWVETNTTEEAWKYYINPKTSFNSGLNTISCKVVDNSGEESGQTYTTITINFDPEAKAGGMVVTVAPQPVEGSAFIIYVNDADSGEPMENFNLTIAGKTYQADGNVTLKLSSGDYPLNVKKIGYNEVSQKISVSGSGGNPIFLIVVAIVVIVIAQQVYSRFIKKK
ncbi:PQQ-binding-like beta-propeller repeat protein [Candidatus Micrarchaeota archaeon]|nr:PQQ-binding-like beta-propeller repeat protein [Candidatus Micrarchaeota archaeon]